MCRQHFSCFFKVEERFACVLNRFCILLLFCFPGKYNLRIQLYPVQKSVDTGTYAVGPRWESHIDVNVVQLQELGFALSRRQVDAAALDAEVLRCRVSV